MVGYETVPNFETPQRINGVANGHMVYRWMGWETSGEWLKPLVMMLAAMRSWEEQKVRRDVGGEVMMVESWRGGEGKTNRRLASPDDWARVGGQAPCRERIVAAAGGQEEPE